MWRPWECFLLDLVPPPSLPLAALLHLFFGCEKLESETQSRANLLILVWKLPAVTNCYPPQPHQKKK